MPKHDNQVTLPVCKVHGRSRWALTPAGYEYSRGAVNVLSQTLLILEYAPSVESAREFISRDIGWIVAEPDTLWAQVYMLQDLEALIARLLELGYLRPMW